MNQNYKIMKDGSIRAPFETGEELAVFRINYHSQITEYMARQANAQPVSRDTPTKLGAMLFDIPEPKAEEPAELAKMLLDTAAINISEVMKIAKKAKPVFA